MYYGQPKIAIISGAIATVLSVVGIVFCFIEPIVTIVCAVFSMISSIIQVSIGDQNGFTTEIISIVIGIVVALIISAPIFLSACFAICIENVLMLIAGWIYALISKK